VTRHIFIFDLDGVLVQPGGYRHAIDATMQHFTRSWGLGEIAPGEETVALCEAHGITSEWDILPICLACLLESILKFNENLHLPSQPDLALDLSEFRECIPALEFRSYIEHIGRINRGHLAVSELLLQTELAEPAISPFPLLAREPVFRRLFDGTRSVSISPVTRLFQNYILGTDAFQLTYHLPAQVNTTSFLKRYDQPLLSSATFRTITGFWKTRRVNLAVMTARPSLAPVANANMPGATPEAELALELIGLQFIPLVGYGSLGWIAAHHGILPESLIKPAPFQALAALLASDGRPISLALQQAMEMILKFGEVEEASINGMPMIRGEIWQDDALVIHVFEDSPIGIQSVRQAADFIAKVGPGVQVQAWGIASQPDKVNALERAGAVVMDSVNKAIPAALNAAGMLG